MNANILVLVLINSYWNLLYKKYIDYQQNRGRRIAIFSYIAAIGTLLTN